MERRYLGLVDYASTFEAMKQYTRDRDESSPNQLWLLQHYPVFTLGLSGKTEHVLAPGDIPIIQVDRGGQVTYHGPGQWVVYILFDLRGVGMGVRTLVSIIEQAVIGLLADYGIDTTLDPKAPGVYVNNHKIASLGLKISRGASYHGIALNVDMDLEPFQRINPCGYAGLQITSMANLLGSAVNMTEVGEGLLSALESRL